MKSFITHFILWVFLDVCLAIVPIILFVGLVIGSGPGRQSIPTGWLALCGFLAVLMVIRLYRAGLKSYLNQKVALSWRILTFSLHFGVLAFGLYFTFILAMILIGAGSSVGEPMG